MRNQPETLHEYNIPRLNWWFLVSGFVFLLSLVLMIWVDYAGGYIPWLALHGDREWKNYQHQFYALDMKRLAADAKTAEVKANEAGMSKMQEDLDKTKRELEGKKPEEAKLQAAVDQARVEDDLITRQFTMEKAVRDQNRSLYEEALERNNMKMDAPEVRESKAKAEKQNGVVADLDLRKQEADAKLQAAKDNQTVLMGHEVELQHSIKRLDDGIKLLRSEERRVGKE